MISSDDDCPVVWLLPSGGFVDDDVSVTLWPHMDTDILPPV